MKKVLLGIFLIAAVAACKSKKEDALTSANMLPMNPGAYAGSVLADSAKISKEAEEAETETIVYKKRPKKKIIYYDEPAVSNPVPVAVPASNPEVVTAPPVIAETPSTVPSTSTSTGQGDDDNAAIPAPETKKKGWSNSAKGAVIGAVGGAVAGAVINGKNRGKGAIIGGVIGAAGGYILGRGKDKKEQSN